MPQPNVSLELDSGWRARAASAQQEAMPDGRVAVSCPAPFGVGGLGRHLLEVVDALARRGARVTYACKSGGAPPAPGPAGRAAAVAREVPSSRALAAAISPLTRLSPPVRMWAALAEFDRRCARAVFESRIGPIDHLIAFNGAALHQFRAAGALHAPRERPTLGLVSATAHIRTVLSQHELAHRQYPLERSWAPRLAARTLAEYERAQLIYVATRRVRDSFLGAGVSEERVREFALTPDPRFSGARASSGPGPGSDAFEVVYVGGLSVVKGVPLLVDAVSRLDRPDLRLVLVGGYGTRGMRRFIERARARDERIVVTLGDPLAHLRHAHVYVHPSYDDGFGYAPAEALAAGVPVIATDSTGMAELITPRGNGAIVATGDAAALAEAIDAAYRGELLRG